MSAITREELTYLWVIKHLAKLADFSPYKITPEGEQAIVGFEPTQEEVRQVIATMKQNGVLKLEGQDNQDKKEALH